MNRTSLTEAEREAFHAAWFNVHRTAYAGFVDDLALVLAAAKAEAWDEGRQAGVDDMIAAEVGSFRRRKPNPYRNEAA